MKEAIDSIGGEIYAGLLARLDTLKPNDTERQLLLAASQDAAQLAIRAMAAPAGSPEADALAGEKAQVNAQLLNVQAALEVSLVDAFWASVADVATRVLSFVAKAAL